MILGVMILPPFGGLIGVFLGILLAEVLNHNDKDRAIRAATGGLVGSMIGMGVTLVLSLVFFFLFIIFGIK